MDPGTAGHPLPAGELLRTLLLYICDAAVRSGEPVVELGESAAALAAQLGVPAQASAVRTQMERILAASIAVSIDGGPYRPMFDRRAAPRQTGGDWRAAARFNASFLAGLTENAVPLDRAVVEALQAAPTDFDAYLWTRHALHRAAPGETVSATWPALHGAFATASQDVKTFRAAFEAALQRVVAADSALRLVVTPAEISLSVQQEVADAAETVEDVTVSPPAGDAVAPGPDVPGLDSPCADAPALDSPLRRAPSAVAPKEAPEAVPQDEVAAGPEDAPEEEPQAPPMDASAPPPGPAAAIVVEPGELPPPAAVAVPLEPARPAAIPDTISLRSELTGLPQVIWLRRGYGADSPLVGVTPGAHFDAQRLTLLAIEPLVLQVSGGLQKRDFDQVAVWIAANRDLIDDIWAGQVTFSEEINRRVRKPPAPGWR